MNYSAKVYVNLYEKEILPYGNQWEKEEKISRDLFLKLGEQGFLGIQS
jgi:hypothetical protein